MHSDLPRLSILAAVRTVQHQDLAFTRLPVINTYKAVPHQQPAVLIHFAQVYRITRPVAARIGCADMAKPVQLSVRMPQQLGAGAGREEWIAALIGPRLGRAP